jgi:hypothetical protein
MVGFATFLFKDFVYIFLNLDVSQMCSEAKSMASDSAINGNIYTIHKTTLKIHEAEKNTKYSEKY